jgi:hypothetical protein
LRTGKTIKSARGRVLFKTEEGEMSYPRKSFVQSGQELHDAFAELWAALRDAYLPVLKATADFLMAMMNKWQRRATRDE